MVVKCMVCVSVGKLQRLDVCCFAQTTGECNGWVGLRDAEMKNGRYGARKGGDWRRNLDVGEGGAIPEQTALLVTVPRRLSC